MSAHSVECQTELSGRNLAPILTLQKEVICILFSQYLNTQNRTLLLDRSIMKAKVVCKVL